MIHITITSLLQISDGQVTQSKAVKFEIAETNKVILEASCSVSPLAVMLSMLNDPHFL